MTSTYEIILTKINLKKEELQECEKALDDVHFEAGCELRYEGEIYDVKKYKSFVRELENEISEIQDELALLHHELHKEVMKQAAEKASTK